LQVTETYTSTSENIFSPAANGNKYTYINIMCTLGILLQTHDLMTAIRPYVSKMLQSTLMFWSKKFGVIIADAAKFHGQYADVTQSSSRTESTELLKYFKNMQVNVTGEQK